MKKITTLFLAIILVASCSKFDDSELWDKINDHELRIAYLEEVCRKMNTDISNLQSIVTALETSDYIVNAFPLADGNGYTLIFKSGKSIVIQNGKDGINGIDGTTPAISVKKDTDGFYYWTVNGEWLLVDGKKVRASATDGSDGITPKFKIEEGYWYVSYDNGNSWELLGKATGSNGLDGADGDSIFKRVYIEDGYVCFELNDNSNTIIRIPLIKDGILNISIEKEGSLSEILTSEETRTTTSLIISGRINREDMRHIQIMNNLHTLDLSNAIYYDSISTLKINPYNDVVVNKSIETLILPKEAKPVPYYGFSVDISYCLSLRKVVISKDNTRFYMNYADDQTNSRIKFCPSLKILEFAEGVTTPSITDGDDFDDLDLLETIIYPSSLKHIPESIALANLSDVGEYHTKDYLYNVICKRLICKATTPPTFDKSTSADSNYIFYSTEKKCYYYQKKELGITTTIYRYVELPDNAILYVPRESIELYRTAPLWENFTDIRAIEDIE